MNCKRFVAVFLIALQLIFLMGSETVRASSYEPDDELIDFITKFTIQRNLAQELYTGAQHLIENGLGEDSVKDYIGDKLDNIVIDIDALKNSVKNTFLGLTPAQQQQVTTGAGGSSRGGGFGRNKVIDKDDAKDIGTQPFNKDYVETDRTDNSTMMGVIGRMDFINYIAKQWIPAYSDFGLHPEYFNYDGLLYFYMIKTVLYEKNGKQQVDYNIFRSDADQYVRELYLSVDQQVIEFIGKRWVSVSRARFIDGELHSTPGSSYADVALDKFFPLRLSQSSSYGRCSAEYIAKYITIKQTGEKVISTPEVINNYYDNRTYNDYTMNYYIYDNDVYIPNTTEWIEKLIDIIFNRDIEPDEWFPEDETEEPEPTPTPTPTPTPEPTPTPTPEPEEPEEDGRKGFFASVIDFCSNFFKRLADMILGIIIPRDEYFDGFGADMKQVITDKFPFIQGFMDNRSSILGGVEEAATDSRLNLFVESDKKESEAESQFGTFNVPSESNPVNFDYFNFDHLKPFQGILHGVILLLAYFRFGKRVLRDIGNVIANKGVSS